MLQRSALARAAVSEERKRMNGRLGFLLSRLRERLWVRPLVFCILSVAGVFVARLADKMAIDAFVPEVDPDSIETLLSIMAASMLVIATFAVASMVSAYASASGTATPRSFPLVLSDDVSQNALSVFIGAFIFSIVALVTLKNGYFARAGNFALFAITLGVFAWVVLTFVRWVDKIARLGRLGATIDKVEAAAANALARRRRSPNLGGGCERVGAPATQSQPGRRAGGFFARRGHAGLRAHDRLCATHQRVGAAKLRRKALDSSYRGGLARCLRSAGKPARVLRSPRG
jgi:uncharacterized membrane protein